jgi:uncharacterized protein (DUF433 family)
MMNPRISLDPAICHGKPTIKGTRVLVQNILGALASGESMDDVFIDYPNITKEDIYAALDYAGTLASFNTFEYSA